MTDNRRLAALFRNGLYSLSRRLSGTVFGMLLSGCLFWIHPVHPVFAQNQNQSPALLGGRSAGSARVGDSGAAAYAVSITVPPGIVAPNLSIVYNSQSSENELLGIG